MSEEMGLPTGRTATGNKPGFPCLVCKHVNDTDVLACAKCGTVPEKGRVVDPEEVPDLRAGGASLRGASGGKRIALGALFLVLGIVATVLSSHTVYIGLIATGVIYIILGIAT